MKIKKCLRKKKIAMCSIRRAKEIQRSKLIMINKNKKAKRKVKIVSIKGLLRINLSKPIGLKLETKLG